MVNTCKKVCAVIMCALILAACAACLARKEDSKVNAGANKAPITSEWIYDHAVSGGKYVPRLSTDKEDDPKIPHFKTDGKTFTLNITEKRTYSGSVEDNGDGTYSLSKSGNQNKLLVKIEGNSLTVQVNENNCVVFVVKE